VPGQVLQIPTRLRRARPVPANLVSSNGDMRVGNATAVEGSALPEGQTVQTGPGGSAVVELADGSRLRLPPSSSAKVIASQNLGARPTDAGSPSTANSGPARAGRLAGALRVLSGSVEVFAAKVLRAKPLELVTPTAVVGVRCTGFRVGFTEAANGSTRVEVVEGQVRFDVSAKPAGANVAASFGSATNAAASPPRVVKRPRRARPVDPARAVRQADRALRAAGRNHGLARAGGGRCGVRQNRLRPALGARH